MGGISVHLKKGSKVLVSHRVAQALKELCSTRGCSAGLLSLRHFLCLLYGHRLTHWRPSLLFSSQFCPAIRLNDMKVWGTSIRETRNCCWSSRSKAKIPPRSTIWLSRYSELQNLATCYLPRRCHPVPSFCRN